MELEHRLMMTRLKSSISTK